MLFGFIIVVHMFSFIETAASGKLVIVVINAISIQSLSLFAKYFSLAVWLSADADGQSRFAPGIEFTDLFNK